MIFSLPSLSRRTRGAFSSFLCRRRFWISCGLARRCSPLRPRVSRTLTSLLMMQSVLNTASAHEPACPPALAADVRGTSILGRDGSRLALSVFLCSAQAVERRVVRSPVRGLQWGSLRRRASARRAWVRVDSGGPGTRLGGALVLLASPYLPFRALDYLWFRVPFHACACRQTMWRLMCAGARKGEREARAQSKHLRAVTDTS